MDSYGTIVKKDDGEIIGRITHLELSASDRSPDWTIRYETGGMDAMKCVYKVADIKSAERGVTIVLGEEISAHYLNANTKTSHL